MAERHERGNEQDERIRALLAPLNTEQQRIVTQGDGACLVLAGAGSGKTKTVTARVAYLLLRGVVASQILLVTFTNKAAKEMVERLSHLATPESLDGLWAGTFHHVAHRLLRHYGREVGVPQNFTILDADDATALMKGAYQDEGFDPKSKLLPSPQVLVHALSYARNTLGDPVQVMRGRYDIHGTRQQDIERIIDRYRIRKTSAHVLDFDDLLTKLVELLEAPQGRVIAERFHYVLVDEYQDTNALQGKLVDRFVGTHGNILVVGDDAQSIYAFRGAHIANILYFEKRYPHTRTFKLEINYRSTPEIVQLANASILNNQAQHRKTLRSARERGVLPKKLTPVDPFTEGETIARLIEERIAGKSVRANDIAVLFRSTFQSQPLEVALQRKGIVYEYRGGMRFFERAHVKDVLVYLRILNNLRDTLAWERMLKLIPGVGDVSIGRISAVLRDLDISDLEGIAAVLPQQAPARARTAIEDCLKLLIELDVAHKGCASVQLGNLVRTIIDRTYRKHLSVYYENAEERLEDLNQLAAVADRAAHLEDFLALAVLTEEYTTAGRVADGGRIVLSTIHQAKGLEWDVVVVLGLSEGYFPHHRSQTSADLEEERRLFYVAVTRARAELILSSPMSFRDMSLTQESRFIAELPDEFIASAARTWGKENVYGDQQDAEEVRGLLPSVSALLRRSSTHIIRHTPSGDVTYIPDEQ